MRELEELIKFMQSDIYEAFVKVDQLFDKITTEELIELEAFSNEYDIFFLPIMHQFIWQKLEGRDDRNPSEAKGETIKERAQYSKEHIWPEIEKRRKAEYKKLEDAGIL